MQRITQYFDDLSMKSICQCNEVCVIRILSRNALMLLRECIGVGVGVGLGKAKPTKAKPIEYCCMNDIITSIEVAPMIPHDFINNPRHKLNCDGIDLLYTVQNQSLQCNIWYSKVIVINEDTVRDRIALGSVHARQIIPYIGAMFFFVETNELCSIEQINNGFALCSYMEDVDRPPFRLTLQEVIPLISTFGTSGNNNSI